MLRYLRQLALLTVLLSGYSVFTLAQGNGNKLLLPLKDKESKNKADRHTFEAEAANLIGGASKVSDSSASCGFTARLDEPGDGIRFSNLPDAGKLAIRYASVEVGTISVAVNGQPIRKVNVHSSGDLTSSFLYAITDIEPEITAYPFQTETSIADWHYRTGQKYMEAKKVIELLMQNVSRNGTMLLNITQKGRGDLDPEVIRICKDVGAWLKINGEAVYGSRPFEVFGNDTVCYTRNHGYVYATLLDWNGSPISLGSLRTGSSTLGKVSKVELLGSNLVIDFVQDEKGLTITPVGLVRSLSGIDDQSLASKCRVLRITHNKDWINDDDPGVIAPGWLRKCNLGSGDYNNDLTTSNSPGDVWTCSFSGTKNSVIAPKEPGAGKIEVQIDDKTRVIADLSITGTRQAQEVVCEISDLTTGRHTIRIINRGLGPVSVDAMIVKEENKEYRSE